MNLSSDSKAHLLRCIDRLGRPMVDERSPFVESSILPVLDLTLRELFENFGSKAAFVDWIKAVREITTVHGKLLDIAVKEGEVVSRDLVKRGVIAPFEESHRKLLLDAPRTIVARMTAMVKAKRTAEECEDWVLKTLSRFIRGAKGRAKAGLRRA